MSYCILLVEDERLIRLTLVETLEDAGYSVIEAVNGDEACALMEGRNGFDALLTDIQMPGAADGIEVARAFNKRHPLRPVVFMTGRPESLARVGRLSRHEVLLRKPFGSAQMLGALEDLLSIGEGSPPNWA